MQIKMSSYMNSSKITSVLKTESKIPCKPNVLLRMQNGVIHSVSGIPRLKTPILLNPRPFKPNVLINIKKCQLLSDSSKNINVVSKIINYNKFIFEFY